MSVISSASVFNLGALTCARREHAARPARGDAIRRASVRLSRLAWRACDRRLLLALVLHCLVARWGIRTPSCSSGLMSSRWWGSQRRSVFIWSRMRSHRDGRVNQCGCGTARLGRSRRSRTPVCFPAHGDEAVFVGGYVDKKRLLTYAMPAQNTFRRSPRRAPVKVLRCGLSPTLLTWEALGGDLRHERRAMALHVWLAQGVPVRARYGSSRPTPELATRFNPLAEIRIGEPPRGLGHTESCDDHLRRTAKGWSPVVPGPLPAHRAGLPGRCDPMCSTNEARERHAATLSDLRARSATRRGPSRIC